jgi:hypothetical protein
MDSIGAEYKFVEYKGATDAFSNPDATLWVKNSTYRLLIIKMQILLHGMKCNEIIF